MVPPDKITQPNEVVRKHRSKRRLLRNLRETWRKKEKEASKAESGGTTESDDSESESLLRYKRRLMLKHEMFTTKRDVDQSSEGAFLRRANKEMLFSDRLLPPTEGEVEDEELDFQDSFGRITQIQDSYDVTKKSNRSYDSIYANLDKCSYNMENLSRKEGINELSKFLSNDEPLHFFDDDDNKSAGSCSTHNRIRKGKNLSVKFADECGKDLELIHYTITLYSEEENDWVRTIILLLSPRQKMFEFLHVSYNVCDKTSIADILEQLPDLATDSALKEQRYVGLLRQEGERELINTVSIQSYGLCKDEIIVAVVAGHHGKAIMRMAKPLLENKRIVKAVKRAKNKKVSVQKLHSLPKKSSRKGKRKSSKESKKENIKPKIHPISKSKSSVAPVVAPPRESELGRTGMRRNTSSNSISDDGSSTCSIPDLDAIDKIDQTPVDDYFDNTGNRDKIAMTRFVNAGIFAALVCGVQKRFSRR
mmetsp:Transcript_25590/g.37802  ORF Transcript_25590/g.37802 Transcript_25590/m.37802 type:complete len:478 (-) Transcript_25590:742-2175(-)|eukprot:CAMPEP_0194209970 /NCGR_PEP_ID=MMETSP0156-20130528/7915_1 /TAXON_ID=33649 /ORGANISM="Thalassionema nitzschioides, Strain L26-B" /LENGTH=477 /DNA_ID=CAMNT_0038937237 /DNA_START=53 /DNA_END=1486 /DNA_ORIENTATION=+